MILLKSADRNIADVVDCSGHASDVVLRQDVHPEVEGECRTLVKYIEGLLGESIESYLN